MAQHDHIMRFTFIQSSSSGDRIKMPTRSLKTMCGLRIKSMSKRKAERVSRKGYCRVCVEKLMEEINRTGVPAFVESPITKDDFIVPPASVEPKMLDVTHQARVGSV